MREAIACSQCGQTIPPDAPQGVCPACVMHLGVAGHGSMLEEAPTIAPPRAATDTPAETVDDGGPIGHALPQSPVPVPGYEILGELGRGAMGVVYKARQIKLNRIVALKMILAGGHAAPAELARFRTEAEAIARLQHPNIVQVHEVGEHDSKPYFSLEFCAGGSLAQKARGKPWGADDAARLVETLARAMDAAHQNNVVHRDLKPANILLASATPDLVPKISDFGLAKKLDEAGQTQSGAIMGTPSYMAPEQAGGQRDTVGPRADVYALGAILYELLTGRPPFLAANALDTLLQVVSDDPVPVSRLQPKTPKDLETICLKCLHKDPVKRYASGLALAEDLRRFRHGEPILARRVPAWERALKWVKRHKTVSGLLTATGAATVVLLVLGIIAWQNAELRAEAVQDLATARGEVAQQQGLVVAKRAEVQRLEGVAQQARTDADQVRNRTRRIVYAADMQFAHAAWETNNIARLTTLLARHRLQHDVDDLRGFEWHYLHRLCHRDRLTLGADGESDAVPEFVLAFTPIAVSADGKTLAAAIPEKNTGAKNVACRVRRWDVATGKELSAFGVPDILFALAFAPDGGSLVGMAMDPVALELNNIVAAQKADVQVLLGMAKPSLKNLLNLYRLHTFDLDGRERGQARKADLAWLRGAGRLTEITLRQTFKGGVFAAASAAGSADGKVLALGGAYVAVGNVLAPPLPGSVHAEPTVLLWDLGKAEPRPMIKVADRGKVMDVAFAADGKTLAVAVNKLIRLYDAATGKERLALRSPGAGVRAVAFAPDGKTVAAGGLDGAVLLLDADTGELRSMFKGHRTSVTTVAFTPDGKSLASVSSDGVIKLWELKSETAPTRFRLDSTVVALTFDAAGKTLKAATNAGTITRWDLTTGAAHASGKPIPPSAELCYSPDMRTVAVSVPIKQIVSLRDAATSMERHALKGHTKAVRRMAFSANGGLLATAGADGAVRLWDVGTGTPLHTLAVDATAIAFAPDGLTLATTTMQKTVVLWDIASGEERGVMPAHPQLIDSLAYSTNGKRLAGAGGDAVTIWDVAARRAVHVLQTPAQFFRAIAFSHDGKRLVTVSSRTGVPGEVRLWDPIAGVEVLSLPLTNPSSTALLQAAICRVAFSRDDRRLAVSEVVWDGLTARSEISLWDATAIMDATAER